MRSFDTAKTRGAIRDQVTKFTAWTKDLNPRDQTPAKIGMISAQDIEHLGVDKDVIPGMKDMLEKVGHGKPVAAPKLISALSKAIDKEVVRVAGKRGSEDAKTLDVRELRQISETLRPLALRAVAYGHDDYFGSFADTSKAFDRLYAAAMGLEYPVLQGESLALVNSWLKYHNQETTEVSIPEAWKVKQHDIPKGPITKEVAQARRDLGGDYKVTVYRDPANGSYALYAASTNGPNQEGLVIFKANSERVAELHLNDDGTRSSDPDFPENG